MTHVLKTRSRTVELTVQHRDRTRTFLLLHGGGGVATMAGLAGLLAERTHSRVLLPTHPGFGGTPKPDGLVNVADLAMTYVALLDQLDLTNVTVLGNSFGGWVAAEMALLGSPRVSGAVLVDAIGIEVDDHPVTDVRGLSPAELRKLSWHDPSKAPQPTTTSAGPSPDVLALIGYTGPAMSDPTLAERLGQMNVPVHVVWGASDGIVEPAYGKAFAAAIPRSTFTLLPGSGHLPQVETPEDLLDALLLQANQAAIGGAVRRGPETSGRLRPDIATRSVAFLLPPPTGPATRMSARFQELDWRETPLGELSLRRRRDPGSGKEIHEIKLNDEFLMSSMFTDAEVELARLALADLPGEGLNVVVGGLGLGYTAETVLECPRTGSLLVVDALNEVIDWHRQGLIPAGSTLTADARCRLVHGDFFAMLRSGHGFDPDAPGRVFDAIIVDIDHSPRHLLHPSNADLYQPEGLQRLAELLRPDGIFALWSNDPPDEEFTTTLATAFTAVRAEVISFRNPLQDRDSTNTVYLAKRG